MANGMFYQNAQQALRQSDEERALRLAELGATGMGPTYYSALAGASMGRALGGLFGLEDPRLTQARQMEEAMAGIDVSTPQGLRQLAMKRYQFGDMEGALNTLKVAESMVPAASEWQTKMANNRANVSRMEEELGVSLTQSQRDYIATREGLDIYKTPEGDVVDPLASLVGSYGRANAQARAAKKPPPKAGALPMPQQAQVQMTTPEVVIPPAQTVTTADGFQIPLETAVEPSAGFIPTEAGGRKRAMQETELGIKISAEERARTKAEQEAAQEKQKEMARAQSQAKSTAIVQQNVQDAIDLIKGQEKDERMLPATGVGGALVSYMGPFKAGTARADLESKIDTIKANVGFDRLQEMRNISQTGGALGQVAVKELDFLQATLGSLNLLQSDEEIIKSLETIQESYNKLAEAASQFMTENQLVDFGFKPPSTKDPLNLFGNK